MYPWQFQSSHQKSHHSCIVHNLTNICSPAQKTRKAFITFTGNDNGCKKIHIIHSYIRTYTSLNVNRRKSNKRKENAHDKHKYKITNECRIIEWCSVDWQPNTHQQNNQRKISIKNAIHNHHCRPSTQNLHHTMQHEISVCE